MDKIKSGKTPFYEVKAKKILLQCLKKKSFFFSKSLKTVKLTKFIILNL